MFQPLTFRSQFLCLAEISGPGSHILSIWQVPLRRTPHEPQTVIRNPTDASRTAFSGRHSGPAADVSNHTNIAVEHPDNAHNAYLARRESAGNNSRDATRDGSRTDAANYTGHYQPW